MFHHQLLSSNVYNSKLYYHIVFNYLEVETQLPYACIKISVNEVSTTPYNFLKILCKVDYLNQFILPL